MANKLYVVGVGSGNCSLLTKEAINVINQSEILIFPNKEKENCTSYSILAKDLDLESKSCLFLDFPMTKDEKILKKAHQEAVQTIQECLKEKMVSFIVLGDPTLYSTFINIEEYFEEYEIVNGISSIHAVAAKCKISLAAKNEEVHILPSTYDIHSSFGLRGTLVFMKAGKELERLKEYLKEKRKTYDFEVYGASNCGMEGETICHNIEELDTLHGYFTTIIVKNIVPRDKQYKFFQHRNCEYFPCHKIEKEEDFNCLFCYCPFYSLGKECGGNYSYTKKGIKSCVNCTYPHQKKNYEKMIERLSLLNK